MTKRKSTTEFDDNAVEEPKKKKKSKKEKRKTNDGEEVTEEIESREDAITQSTTTEDAEHGREPQDRFPNSIPVKKTKKNRNRKKDDGAVKKVINQEEPNPDPRIKVALKYLKTWYKHRDQWKFQKVRQLCLLQHMYDHTKISDRKFKRLLEYLSGLVGCAREQTIKEAGQILVDNDIGSDNEEDDENSEENEKLKTVKIKIERATKILQQLS
ncbi:uncharacterized protein C7orf50 homolog [Patella vulgata]|uniref:uncharacterized protein C7orf50 homolog n=1 Tax=Patella vulgata TaxID=6465 RepID=UPI00217F55AB|nr:uncharacterized protein C7orf50 homolog [Patella vulgata]